MQSRPCVSVILAVFNEERFIEPAVASLCMQAALDFDLEVLVVDGASTDGTAEKVLGICARDARVRLITNERRKTPYAFNVGLQAARGEYVCILGAHTVYPRDYISVCLHELLSHNAAGCSGRMITAPANRSLTARLAAWTMAHPLACSGSSVRTQTEEGFVDTIPYPVMVKQALLDSGGYDEHLHRNQDNDMNQRLRAAGHMLYLTGKTQSLYYARPGVSALWQYAFSAGVWNAFTLRRNVACMALRHFVPFVFVFTLIVLIVLALIGLVTVSPYAWIAATILLLTLVAHLVLGLIAGLQTGIREKDVRALLLAPVIFGFHCAYGLGTLWGFLRFGIADTGASPSSGRCQRGLNTLNDEVASVFKIEK